MLWAVYNVLFGAAYLAMLPYFLYRMCRRGGYRRGFAQRFTILGPELTGRIRERATIWVHAVSVGEIQVAFRFMEEIRSRLPGVGFVLTTTTSTAYRLAEKRIGGDVLLYFPMDFPGLMRRALNVIRPLALILTESELWPNLIRLAHGRGVPVFLINGRISAKSHRGYRWVRRFMRPTLRALRLLLVQGEADRDRLLDLGAAPESIHVMGTAKYDIAGAGAGPAPEVGPVLAACGVGPGDPVLLGGSTWPGEERALLAVYARLRGRIGNLRLVLVPRHFERAGEVGDEAARQGLSFVRRSAVRGGGADAARAAADVLVVDTTGELPGFYAYASVVFVGKSLTQHGGQNPIEPAALGKPVVVGPNMENFNVVTADLLEARAIVQVADAGDLAPAVERFLTDPELARDYGRRARECVRRHTGVVSRSVALILEQLAATGAAGG